MNFSNSKKFFSKNFSSHFYNNKFSFKFFNTKINSNKFFVHFQNKFYTTNVNLLVSSDQFKSDMIPLPMRGNGFMMEQNEETVLENLMEMLGSSKNV